MSIKTESQGVPTPRELGAWQDWADLQQEWWHLWRECPAATPFQSPAWLLGWWRHFGSGQLRVIHWRAAGKLVGLAPFFIYPTPQTNRRTLALAGMGISDYLDILVAPGWETKCAQQLRQWLTEHGEEWDTVDWQELRPGSPLLDPEITSHYEAHVDAQSVCPALELPPAGAPWPGPQPARLLQDANYYLRKAKKTEPVKIVIASKDNLSELFETFLAVHESRWQARNETGVLADVALQNFHCETAAEFLREGVLRLYGLRLAGSWAASFYGWHHRQCLYYYLGGFDPQWRQLSPGTVIIAHALQAARAEGAIRFDFLRGAEPYKYRWGARDAATYRCRFPSHRAMPADRNDQTIQPENPLLNHPLLPVSHGYKNEDSGFGFRSSFALRISDFGFVTPALS